MKNEVVDEEGCYLRKLLMEGNFGWGSCARMSGKFWKGNVDRGRGRSTSEGA